MADFTQLPDDLSALIAQYLSVQELTIFKIVCKNFNKIGSAYAFLQPLYNRLYKLDPSLPALLDPQNAVFEFKKACEKISLRQKQEIAFLKHKHQGNPNYSEQLAQLDASDQTISRLEKQHVLLEDINASIINARIELAKNSTDSSTLNLNREGITRFFISAHHADFLKKLSFIMLDNNLLTSVNVKNFTALETLFCHEIGSAIHINMENCVALETVHFLHEAVVDINIKGASEYAQTRFLEMETKLLFKQLSQATNPNQQSQLIERLGERFTVQNCIQHRCASYIGMCAKASISSAFTTVCNTINQYGYLPSFMNYGTATQESHKRKREDEDNNPVVTKKRKPSSP